MNSKKWICGNLALALMISLSAAIAQQKAPAVSAFGSDTLERGTVRVGYWNNEKNTGAGGFFIVYGKPVWKKDYEDAAKFDAMTKGRVWRMGSDYWTVLDTNIPLRIAGTTVPVGQWYLGLERSQDGTTWSLVFIDPAKVRSTRLDPSEINKTKAEFKARMSQEQTDEFAEKLTITADVPKTDLKQSRLTISWGKLRLSAPVEASL
ncbi:MAG TPA: DUF2911 domain-containing protein [Blastocatellia bacterium]|jgi:hypothetical protein